MKIIVVDTRQQDGRHALKDAYFEEHGVKTVRSKLIVGDYARIDNQTVSVDTKRNILELAGNICGKQHERFRNECIRARDCGIKLIILSKRTQVSGETLGKAMKTMTEKYGVQFEFCAVDATAKRIIDILFEE